MCRDRMHGRDGKLHRRLVGKLKERTDLGNINKNLEGILK
jgi:hypothetical protein